jgi:glycosyltransferase involved in cell wall biosynthesis
MKTSSRRSIVCIGSLPPPPNGQSAAFEMLVQRLKQEKTRLAVIDLVQTRNERGELDRIRRLLDYAKLLPRYLAALLRVWPRTVYLTIAQSRLGFYRDAVFIWIARLFRFRVVSHLHGGNYDGFFRSQPRWLQRLIRSTLRQLDAVIVLGESLKPMFDFEPSLLARLHVVPNGLSRELDVGAAPKRIPDDPREPVRILYLSNLIESKGYFDVLEAVRILVQEHHLPVRCDFCGDFLANPSDDRIVRDAVHARALFDELVARHGLSDHVFFNGVVSGGPKVDFLRKAHFFVLPTHYDNEGQPISIIEAMAFGCPVVTTDYRAIPDLVEPESTGFLVPPDRPDQIAECIAQASKDGARYRSMSAASIQRYKDGFSPDAHLNRMIEVLFPPQGPAPRKD